MAPDQERTSGGRLRHLLVCFDGSPESEEAIELALDLGKTLNAELTIFSVLVDLSHLETTDAKEREERIARELLDTHLEGVKQRAERGGMRIYEASITGGDPAEVIAGYAAEHGFDLVIIGAHGRGRLTHGGLGHVLERLLHEPKCPILVAPERRSG
ncbi:MAG TPA: universal stress protein [Acidimicrobiales bacterium]